MNSLQKIILFVYSIVVSALCLFFMPYHNLKENNIFFESILYEPDYMYIIIDNQRLIIILLT